MLLSERWKSKVKEIQEDCPGLYEFLTGQCDRVIANISHTKKQEVQGINTFIGIYFNLIAKDEYKTNEIEGLISKYRLPLN